MAAKKKTVTVNLSALPPLYKCTRCGKIVQEPKGNFYMVRTFTLYDGNEHYSSVCCGCVNAYFEDMKAKYKNEKLALVLTCCAIGIYFSEELYDSTRDNGEIRFGNYIKALNVQQYRSRNFATYLSTIIQNKQAFRGHADIQAERETKWSAADLKNKNYVLQTIGYDCFEDGSYTDADRKFLMNTLADYLTDDVIDDPHKLQCVIALVKSTLQMDNIDRMINHELRLPVPDHQLILQLSTVKEKLARSINQSANENGISAKSSGKAGRGSGNSLTVIMKEMAENGFEEIKVNVVDAKLAASYREVAQDNIRALMNELNFTGDEYGVMIAEQSQMIADYQTQVMTLEEENRKLKIQLKQMGGDWHESPSEPIRQGTVTTQAGDL